MIAKIDNVGDYTLIILSLRILEHEHADDLMARLSYRITRERLMKSHDEILRESALKDRDPDTGEPDPADDHIPYPW